MCRRITCTSCHRPGWSGCGAHVEQVLGDVAAADRCRCRELPAPQQGSIDSRSWWQRLRPN